MIDAIALLVIVALFAERVWRLLALDDLAARPRSWVEMNTPWWVVAWLHCPWCSGTWLAVGATLLTGWAVHLPLPVWLMAGAAAGLTGIIGTVDRRLSE